MSESEEPITVVQVNEGALEQAAKESTLDEFFAPLTQAEEWHGEEERNEVRRFQELRSTLEKHLREIKVYRIGETEVTILVVGKTDDGRWAGIKTRAVET